ncbi:MAG: ArsA family ATPase [Deltaproteobacteria bacterium]|jgi:anion-transporting  ArsA/GET3 family ATPase|nr:ArsA family ATPase [Deltaproteobacteria bacterium]
MDSSIDGLLGKRLLLVVGKGGVGRTTVAVALARRASRAGKRVLLAQTNAPESLTSLLGGETGIGPTVTVIDERLSAVNMSPKMALREYGVLLLKYEPIYRAFFENKPMRSFLAAFPGLDYWTMLGKAWWHTTEVQDGRHKYDLVVLDAPASGHAVAMLRIPEAVASAMPKGPLARDALLAHDLLTDPKRTAATIVTLPEELPARETVKLARDLRELRIPLGPLVVNAMPPGEAVEPGVAKVLAAAAHAAVPANLAGVLAGTAILAARRRDAERILEELASDPGLPTIHLPRLPKGRLGPEEVEHLAGLLEER